ncbi:DUF6452 family protein [Polaribacter sp. SA4-12]|uniref:DUF6452 family protein n=1 Tax=Polaribacter sp. SA4-12 TaxID=1312072 RepID=UPI000B3D1C01|nr:DUF6452 family protein [Polaribacter sp. SA4-12]ARV14626.1 hypothetical protein BTO07_05435 [Polaribacter sp. SA4-12]
MRKIMFLLGILLLINTSCEKDDFCLKNPVTESLVINFYDDSNKETLKNVTELSVWAEGKTDFIYENQTINTITIPLNSLTTETVYNFSKEGVINQFTITYTPVEEYVSRSCGYKVVFNEVTFSSDNTWIKSFTPETLTTIENQDEAHVQIYH